MQTGQLTALRAELEDDPLGLGLGAASDGEAAALLSAPTRQVPRDIPLGEFQAELMIHGVWAPLKTFAAGARPENAGAGLVWDAVVSTIDLIMAGQAKVIAMTNPEHAALVTAQLDALVAGGFLSGDARAALLALGVAPGSRAEELELGMVTPSDIADARRLIGGGL